MSEHAQKKRKLISDEESEAIRSVARSAYEQHKQEQQCMVLPRQHTPAQQTLNLPSLDELQRAPRFGLNARALILQAAGSVAGPNDSSHLTPALPHPKEPPSMPAGVPPQNLPARLNPTRLLEAVSVQERHFVTYVPRSNIPRLLRQGTADMLLGRYLSHLVGLCQHETPPGQRTEAKALEVIRADADLRATARLAVAAHETALYKQVTSKQAYTALSTNTECSLATLRLHAPADRLEQLLSKYGSSSAAAFAPPPAAAPPATAATPRHVVSEDPHDLFDSSSSDEDEDSSNREGSKGGIGSQTCKGDGGGAGEHSSSSEQAGKQEAQQREAPADHEAGLPGAGDERPSSSEQAGKQEEAPADHEAGLPVQNHRVLEPPACDVVGAAQPDGQQQQQQQQLCQQQQGGIGEELQQLPEQAQQQQQQAGNEGGLLPGHDHQQPGCHEGHQEQLGQEVPACHEGHERHEVHEEQHGQHDEQPGCPREIGEGVAAGCAAGASVSPELEKQASEVGLQELRGEDLQGTMGGMNTEEEEEEEGGHEQKNSGGTEMAIDQQSSRGRGDKKGRRHPSRRSRAHSVGVEQESERSRNAGEQDGKKGSSSSSGKGERRRHRSSSRSRRREEVEEERSGGEGGGVYAQVVAFVRGLLNPLYKARLIPKDRFKAIVQRSSQKIMDRHQDAPDASFLLHEHEAIRRFVLKMVEASQ